MSAAKPPIPPVFVVNTGRCGSTLMSRMLALHPAILSISEFLAALTSEALTADRLDGEAFWRRALAADRGGSWPSAAGMVTGACTVSDAGLKRAGITRAQLGCSRPAS